MRIALLRSPLEAGYGTFGTLRPQKPKEPRKSFTLGTKLETDHLKHWRASSQPDRRQRLTCRGKLTRASGGERILGEHRYKQIEFSPSEQCVLIYIDGAQRL